MSNKTQAPERTTWETATWSVLKAHEWGQNAEADNRHVRDGLGDRFDVSAGAQNSIVRGLAQCGWTKEEYEAERIKREKESPGVHYPRATFDRLVTVRRGGETFDV